MHLGQLKTRYMRHNTCVYLVGLEDKSWRMRAIIVAAGPASGIYVLPDLSASCFRPDWQSGWLPAPLRMNAAGPNTNVGARWFKVILSTRDEALPKMS